ncbi:MAG: DUF5683 domain-containing protein [Bacteroidetes bacterium]|nr:DUF5683 domain-containing protein [Bacteroidota bacterium]
MTNHIVKIVFFLIVFLHSAFPQQDTIHSKLNPSSDSIFVMQKSPWTAVALSAAIPGLGQIYTQSYWKVPVIWGVFGWLVYQWVQNNNLYKDYQNLYDQSSSNSNAQIFYLGQKKIYQDQRDLFSIYIGLTYLLNIVDAYVDAQLFDFSVSKNSVTNSTYINMRIKF